MNGPTPPQAAESGRLYRLVTRYWPRIAVVLVFLVGAAEWIIEGLTAGGALETYTFAWAAVTGSLWFLFEKAEKTLSDEARAKVVGWLTEADLQAKVVSIPEQFAVLFDRIFGERHWSRKCFYRSVFASVLAATLAFVTLGGFISDVVNSYESVAWRRATWTPERAAENRDRCEEAVERGAVIRWGPGPEQQEPYTLEYCEEGYERAMQAAEHADSARSPYQPATILQFLGGFMLLGLLLNALPDYLSLLETRWLIGKMRRGRIVALLVLDIVATSAIQLAVLWGILVAIDSPLGSFPWSVITGHDQWSPFFYSAFFTSVWLWIYAAAVLVSRALVRLGSGAGFLLRVTDVEQRPFQSMGFTAVVLVSAGFLVGLPLVLLG